MVLGQGCPGSRSLRFPTGAGVGVQRGNTAARPRRLGASCPDLGHWWGQQPHSPVSSCSSPPLPPNPPPPPPWCFWASRAHPPAESILWQEGEGSGPPLGETCLWRERWLIYLERKTEVGEVATVAWAWTLAPLPLLGARVQTAAGSALTVFYVGFETRPRGKQREFLLRRKAARGFQLPWIGMESLKGRTGGEAGGLPGLCFRQCRALGPVVLWSLSQGRGSVERALAGRPSGSASERASSFEILWRWGLWKKRRKGSASDQSTWWRTRRRSPSMLPAQGSCPCA